MKTSTIIAGTFESLINLLAATGCRSDYGAGSPYSSTGPTAGKAVGAGVGMVAGNVAGFGVGAVQGTTHGFAYTFDPQYHMVRYWRTETTADGRTIQVPYDILVDQYGRPGAHAGPDRKSGAAADDKRGGCSGRFDDQHEFCGSIISNREKFYATVLPIVAGRRFVDRRKPTVFQLLLARYADAEICLPPTPTRLRSARSPSLSRTTPARSSTTRCAVLEDLLSSRIAGEGYSVISRGVTVNALKSYDTAGIAVSSQTAVNASANAASAQNSAASASARLDAAQQTAINASAGIEWAIEHGGDGCGAE